MDGSEEGYWPASTASLVKFQILSHSSRKFKEHKECHSRLCPLTSRCTNVHSYPLNRQTHLLVGKLASSLIGGKNYMQSK